ncbi:MAG: zinc-ribbon domain containing protein, partial [Verrucomicrobiota bacterium]
VRWRMAQRRLGPVGPPLTKNQLSEISIPPGAVLANTFDQRRKHDLDQVRYYYVDRPFACKACGKEEIWTVDQQKFWYEDCKGDPNAVAIYCHDCRASKKDAT